MNQHSSHRARDLVALLYVEAVQACDLETVAALWDDASQDPELERLLIEIDGALIDEVSRASQNSERVRVGETTLNAPTPILPLSASPRWSVQVGLVGAVVAASLLVYLVWQSNRTKPPTSIDPVPETARENPPQKFPGPEFASALLQAQLDESARMTAFSWPLEMKTPITAGTRIRPDLFN